MKTKEQNINHNVAITAVFGSVKDLLYLIAEIPQVGPEDSRRCVNL